MPSRVTILSVCLVECLSVCLCTAFVCIFSCPAACAFLFPGPRPVQLCQLSLVCLLQWSTPALPLAIRFTGSLSAGYQTVYLLCTDLQFLLGSSLCTRFFFIRGTLLTFSYAACLPVCPVYTSSCLPSSTSSWALLPASLSAFAKPKAHQWFYLYGMNPPWPSSWFLLFFLSFK